MRSALDVALDEAVEVRVDAADGVAADAELQARVLREDSERGVEERCCLCSQPLCPVASFEYGVMRSRQDARMALVVPATPAVLHWRRLSWQIEHAESMSGLSNLQLATQFELAHIQLTPQGFQGTNTGFPSISRAKAIQLTPQGFQGTNTGFPSIARI